MSRLSDRLSELRSEKGINIQEIAKKCKADVTSVFRWFNGERVPNDLKKLRALAKAMRLDPMEIEEIEQLYDELSFGEKYEHFRLFKNVILAVKEGERFLDDVALEKEITQLKHPVSFRLPDFEHIIQEHKVYDMFKRIVLQVKSNPDTKIKLITRSDIKTNKLILRIMCREFEDYEAEQIIYLSDKVSETTVNKKLIAFEQYMHMSLKYPKMQVYLCEPISAIDKMNLILTDDVMFLFDSNMNEAICCSNPDYVNLYQDYFSMVKNSSIKVREQRGGVEVYFGEEDKLDKSTIFRSFEYQPCITCAFTGELLLKSLKQEFVKMQGELVDVILDNYSLMEKQERMYAEIITYFTKEGLEDFLNTGIFNIFQYPIYEPIKKDVKKELIKNAITLMKEKENIHYMTKLDELQNIKNIHVAYVKGKGTEFVRLEFFRSATEIVRFTVEDPDILTGVSDFFECLENERNSSTPQETWEYVEQRLQKFCEE